MSWTMWLGFVAAALVIAVSPVQTLQALPDTVP